MRTARRPPAGSKPIDETEWSADHRVIKEYLGLTPTDHVYIDPDGNVWIEIPTAAGVAMVAPPTTQNLADQEGGVAEADSASDADTEATKRYNIILRIRHPQLDPAEITAVLDWEPHIAWKTGDQAVTPKGTKLPGARRDGVWSRTFRYKGETRIAENLERILHHLISHKLLFRKLHEMKAQTAIYLQMPGDVNNGDRISSDLMRKMAALKISFELEIFPNWA